VVAASTSSVRSAAGLCPLAARTGSSESTPVTVYAFSAADFVELFAIQDSGGALAVNNGEGIGPEFYAFWFRN
jgi:hypothetical protein